MTAQPPAPIHLLLASSLLVHAACAHDQTSYLILRWGRAGICVHSPNFVHSPKTLLVPSTPRACQPLLINIRSSRALSSPLVIMPFDEETNQLRTPESDRAIDLPEDDDVPPASAKRKLLSPTSSATSASPEPESGTSIMLNLLTIDTDTHTVKRQRISGHTFAVMVAGPTDEDVDAGDMDEEVDQIDEGIGDLITSAELEELHINKANLVGTVFEDTSDVIMSVVPRLGRAFAKLLSHLICIDHHANIKMAGPRSATPFGKRDLRPVEYLAYQKAGRQFHNSTFRNYSEDYLDRYWAWWKFVADPVCDPHELYPTTMPGLPKNGMPLDRLLWKGRNGFGIVVAALTLHILALMRSGLEEKVLTFPHYASEEAFAKWEEAVINVDAVAAAIVASLGE
jgi:hypothetical protein